MAESARWERHKAARYKLILDSARKIILEGDVKDLTMRKLADRADCSVRTIYNLIGTQTEVLAAIVQEMKEVAIEAIDKLPESAPMERLEQLVTASTRLILANPRLFKPALRIVEDTPGYNMHVLFEPMSVPTMEAEMKTAIEAGLLIERAPLKLLSQLIFQAAARATADWSKEIISDEEFWRRVLSGLYIGLASVATEPTRTDLLDRLTALAPAEPG